MAQLGLADRLDLLTVVDLVVVVAATGGFQLAVGTAGAALDRVAGAATEAAATTPSGSSASASQVAGEERTRSKYSAPKK